VSARERLAAAVATRLHTVAGLAVFDAPPPPRTALPHAVVEEPELSAWGAACLSVWEGRIAVSLHDAGERPVRLRTLGAAAEAALAGLGGEIGGGWRLTAMRPVRGRLKRAGPERWTWTDEYSVRLFRADS